MKNNENKDTPIQQARNPKWANKHHDAILVEVEFENTDGFVEYCTRATDCVSYSVELYEQAVAGAFGTVTDSDEERIVRGEIPIPEGCIIQDGNIINVAVIEQEAVETLQRKLAELQTPECLARAEIDDEYATQRKARLKALLAVKEQPGWPLEVQWPVWKDE